MAEEGKSRRMHVSPWFYSVRCLKGHFVPLPTARCWVVVLPARRASCAAGGAERRRADGGGEEETGGADAGRFLLLEAGALTRSKLASKPRASSTWFPVGIFKIRFGLHILNGENLISLILKCATLASQNKKNNQQIK